MTISLVVTKTKYPEEYAEQYAHSNSARPPKTTALRTQQSRWCCFPLFSQDRPKFDFTRKMVKKPAFNRLKTQDYYS